MVRHWGKALGILLLVMLLTTVVLLPGSPDIMGADSGWSSPEDICYNSGISQAPRIAVDSENNLYVLWKDYTPGYTGILCRIKPSSGNWSASALEQIPGTSSSSKDPSIAVDHEGRLHAVWKDNISGESGIFWTTRSGGGNWSAPQKITDSSGNSTDPDIAVDAQSNPHVVWKESSSAEEANITYATKSVGTDWLTQKDIFSINPGPSCFPSIAVDGKGDPHVVWPSATLDISYATKPSNGNWSVSQDISHSGKPSSRPSIAVDSDGNPHVVWETTYEYDQYAQDIRVQYTTKSGSNWLDPKTISPSTTGNITLSRHPCIAIDNTGKPNVAWHDMALGYFTIAYAVRHSDGGWLTWPNISRMTLDSSEASMAIDASGNIHVVWQQSVDPYNYNSDIFYATLQTAPPNQPSNIYPADGATGVSLTPTLRASAFSDPEEADALYASQWQITTTPGDYSSPVFDSGVVASNSTQLSVLSDILKHSTTYYWQVRYQDSHGIWSSYSNETSFTTIGHSSWLTLRVIGAIIAVLLVLAVGIWLLFRRRPPAPG